MNIKFHGGVGTKYMFKDLPAGTCFVYPAFLLQNKDEVYVKTKFTSGPSGHVGYNCLALHNDTITFCGSEVEVIPVEHELIIRRKE